VPVLKSFAAGQVFGSTWGPAPARVLALHGWQRTHHDFDAVFDPAGDEGTWGAVGVDLFGFGATPPPPEPWGSPDYASHLVPLFDEPGVLADRVVLVGHSFGGRVAVPLCGLVPDRIERLVLTGVPLLHREGRRSRPATPFRVARRLHRMGLVGEERMEAVRQRYGSPDYRQAQGVMRAVFVRLLGEQYVDGMASVGCPVDLVWGADDTEVPLEVAERARHLFGTSAPARPATTLTVLPGVGHLTPTEAPDALRAVIVGGLS
jgi:pimeloyl-ACP methyl ester carboxylesterase